MYRKTVFARHDSATGYMKSQWPIQYAQDLCKIKPNIVTAWIGSVMDEIPSLAEELWIAARKRAIGFL